MLEGLLKFAPDLAALIRYDEENKQTDKAVYIDAEGNETPICGGGSSDFDVFEVTITADGNTSEIYEVLRSYYDGTDHAIIPCNVTAPYYMIAYQGEITLLTSQYDISNVSGDAEYDADFNQLVITGDCSFTLHAKLS